MTDDVHVITDDLVAPVPVVTTTVDLVVPVYNEERALPGCIEVLHEYLTREMPYQWTITIADNASTDRTGAVSAELAERYPEVRVLRMTRKGRGHALHTAWSRSDAELVAYMDVDLSTGLDALLPLISALANGHSDLAIGTRLASGARTVRGPRRELISRMYVGMIHLLHGARFSDAQCGFKAMRTDLARRLLPYVKDEAWFFDTELLLLAEHNELRIHEVPVDWVEDTDSRVDVGTTAVEDIRGLLRVYRARLSGRATVPDLPQRPEPRPAHPDAVTAAPHRRTAGQLVMFALIGALSTAAHALLYALLRTWWPAGIANLLALVVTALLNTEANRRLTFGGTGAPTTRVHVQGLLVFVLYYAVTTGAVLALHAVRPDASRSLEVLVLVLASIVGTALRFVALKNWIFRETRR
jgi:putative flippase GtrA